jgi:hypothetical protein
MLLAITVSTIVVAGVVVISVLAYVIDRANHS